jgi:hypothetical protein
VTAAVDTGLLDRRRSIMGARARRRRTVVLAVLAGLATVGGGYWALTGPPVAIRHLTLSGYARKDRGALDWAARVAASSGTMVSLPTGRIREALAAFPWVGRVDVRRDWPWGIVVDVHQARAAAVVVPSRGQRMLVSASGRVLGPAPARPGLPRIRMDGPPPAVGGSLTSAAVRAPLAFLAPLPREIARRVRRLGFDENGLLGARTGRSGVAPREGPCARGDHALPPGERGVVRLLPRSDGAAERGGGSHGHARRTTLNRESRVGADDHGICGRTIKSWLTVA